MNYKTRFFIIIILILTVLIIIGAFLLKTKSLSQVLLLLPHESGLIETPLTRDLSSTNEPKFKTNTPSNCLINTVLTLEQLAKIAETIVLGNVTKIAAQKQDNGPNFTTITLTPSESFKKSPSNPLNIKVLGGTVDGITDEIGCEPKFNEEEQVIVFLIKDPDNPSFFKVVGQFQGKFIVSDDNVSREYLDEPLINLEEFRSKIKNLTNNQSLKTYSSPLAFMQKSLSNLFSILIPQALAWQPYIAREGYGVRWPTNEMGFYWSSQPNNWLGNATYDEVRTAMSWWNSTGSSLTLRELGNNDEFVLGNGKNEISFQGGNNLPEQIFRRYDCRSINFVENYPVGFCKLLEVDFSMYAVSADLVAFQFGQAIGLTDDREAVPYLQQPQKIMNTKVLIYPGQSGISDDDKAGMRALYPVSNKITLAQANLTSEEQNMLILLNDYRQANVDANGNPLEPLIVDETLTILARERSGDMAKRGYLSHYLPPLTNYSLSNLMRERSISACGGGAENIELNDDPNPTTFAFNDFKKSPTHNKNMLDSRWKRVGIGVATNNNVSKVKYFFTQVFTMCP